MFLHSCLRNRREQIWNLGLKIEDEVVNIIAENFKSEIIDDKTTSFFSNYRCNTRYFKSKWNGKVFWYAKANLILMDFFSTLKSRYQSFEGKGTVRAFHIDQVEPHLVWVILIWPCLFISIQNFNSWTWREVST